VLICFDIPVGRADTKFGHSNTPKEILAAGSQEQLEHGRHFFRGQRPENIALLWLTKI
jgi:hypothetical protein